MPVLTKEKHSKLKEQLDNRISNLIYLFDKRPLSSNKEGVKGKGHWVNPDLHCATIGDKLELSLAIADFKSILAEIGKL